MSETLPWEDPAVRKAAADWDARLRSPATTDADRAAFSEWRAAAYAHAEAFDALQRAIDTLRRAAASHPQLRSLREQALAGQRRTPRWLAAAVVLPAAVALAAYAWVQRDSLPGLAGQDAAAEYTTATGERSTVTLADGSTLDLNTQTRVRVALSATERSVALLEGQAHFNVAREPARPFRVVAGTQVITALGTTFDVNLKPHEVTITTVEGRIAVSAAHPSATASAAVAKRVELIAGQRITVRDSAAEPIVARANLESTSSWRQGQLIFRNTPLDEAVAEINRYVDTKIEIAEPAMAELRINGMFRTGHTASFIGALEEYFPIVSRRQGKDRIALHWREDPSL